MVIVIFHELAMGSGGALIFSINGDSSGGLAMGSSGAPVFSTHEAMSVSKMLLMSR